MTTSNNPKLAIIVAGGNGAGKSTFINYQLLPLYEPTGIAYLNADDWQKNTFGEFDNTTPHQALQAQQWAENSRKEHIEQGKSFIAETVFSHPSKIELIKEAKANGFTVDLYHINLDSAETALERINERVLLGGHDVDADKVRGRYDRLIPIITEAVKHADKTYVYDNSVMYRPHELILELEKGKIIEIHAELPEWCKQAYKAHLDQFYDTLKQQLTPVQEKAFTAFQDHISKVFKDHPDQLAEKLDALNAKLPDIVSNKYELPEPEKKDKGRDR